MALIDLHTHTTASDGLSSPSQLIPELREAGVEIFSVTDHDTVANLAEVLSLATVAELTFVPGIEITAVESGRDVHILGYFIDAGCPALLEFLEGSRRDRARRGRLMCERLTAAGAAIDFEALCSGLPASSLPVISRPLVADALVSAGHVASRQEAFERFLGEGRAAYVPRIGASAVDAVAIITAAGGLASMAHPGATSRDDLIAPLVEAGLAAIECFHPDHSPAVTSRYVALAHAYGLAVTGGSDFHGFGTRRASSFGRVGLPAAHYETLAARYQATRPGGSIT